MDIQDQIYVISGVVAGLLLLVFVFVGYLMYRVAKITELMTGSRPHEKRDTYAYNNPKIVPGEELNRRGFTMQGDDSGPSSMNRDPLPKLPRLDAGFGNNDRSNYRDPGNERSNNDFSTILNSNEMVFGGDAPRPSNLSRPKPMGNAQQGGPVNYEYNYRPSMGNDNFSFQNPSDRHDRQDQPKNYLNERMQY